jgi:hypothetical protein
MDEILDSRLEGTTLVIVTPDGEVRYDSKFLVAALLIYIARGSGQIEPEESAKMIEPTPWLSWPKSRHWVGCLLMLDPPCPMAIRKILP